VSCPACGGVDRFRFDDKEGRGTYYCNGCGAGDGFDLLRNLFDWDFKEAAAKIDELHGRVVAEPQKLVDLAARRSNLLRVWQSARSPEVVTGYLGQRGLGEAVADLRDVRGCAALRLFERDSPALDCPAVVCLVRNLLGDPVTVHRIYLGPQGRVKKLMPALEKLTGASIRLARIQDGTLVVGEGVESTLAGKLLWERETGAKAGAWAAISANNLVNIALPPEVTRLVICIDNDAKFAGQAFGFELARRASVLPGRPIEVVTLMSSVPGCDVLDALIAGEPIYRKAAT
jgi:putative DNA primase/helicase